MNQKQSTDRGDIKEPEYFLHIIGGGDSILWYRDMVGTYRTPLLVTGCIEATIAEAVRIGHYWSREDGGPRNIVKIEHVEVVDARYQPISLGEGVEVAGWSEDVIPPLPVLEAFSVARIREHLLDPAMNNLILDKASLHAYVTQSCKDHAKAVLTEERDRLHRELEEEFDRHCADVKKHHLNVLALIS